MFIVCMLPNDLALLHGASHQLLVVRLTLSLPLLAVQCSLDFYFGVIFIDLLFPHT